MDSIWTPGDLVELKSGGPPMTVERKPGDVVELKSGGIPMTTQHRAISDQPDEWICVWFEGATLHEGRFNARSLKKHQPGRGGRRKAPPGR